MPWGSKQTFSFATSPGFVASDSWFGPYRSSGGDYYLIQHDGIAGDFNAWKSTTGVDGTYSEVATTGAQSAAVEAVFTNNTLYICQQQNDTDGMGDPTNNIWVWSFDPSTDTWTTELTELALAGASGDVQRVFAGVHGDGEPFFITQGASEKTMGTNYSRLGYVHNYGGWAVASEATGTETHQVPTGLASGDDATNGYGYGFRGESGLGSAHSVTVAGGSFGSQSANPEVLYPPDDAYGEWSDGVPWSGNDDVYFFRPELLTDWFSFTEGDPATNATSVADIGSVSPPSTSRPTLALLSGNYYTAHFDGTDIETWYQDDAANPTGSWNQEAVTYDADGRVRLQVVDNAGTDEMWMVAFDAALSEVAYWIFSTSTGTTFTQGLTGTLTMTGARTTEPRKGLAGTLALTAATILKRAERALTGTLTLTPATILKGARRALTGNLTLSAAAVSVTKLLTLAVSGTLTLTGTLQRRANRILTGALTMTGNLTRDARATLTGALTLTGGAVTREASKALAGAVTLTGAIRKRASTAFASTVTLTGGAVSTVLQAARTFAASLTLTPTLTRFTLKGAFVGTLNLAGAAVNATRVALLALAGVLTLDGTLQRRVTSILSGSITLTGASVRKRASRALTGALTLTGGAVQRTKVILQALAGTLTLTGGAVTKRADKLLAGAVNLTSGAIGTARTVTVALAESITLTGASIIKGARVALSGVVTLTGGAVGTLKVIQRTLTATLNLAGNITREPRARLTAAMTLTGGAIRKRIERTLTAAVNLTGAAVDVTKVLTQALSGSLTLSGGTITRRASKLFTGAVTLTGTITRDARARLQGALTLTPGAVSVTKVLTLALSGTMNLAGAVRRRASITLTNAVTLTGALTREVRVHLDGTLTMSAILGVGRLIRRAFSASMSLAGALATAAIGFTKAPIIADVLAFVTRLGSSVTADLRDTIDFSEGMRDGAFDEDESDTI